MRP
ncbi:unnamed protein product [Gulo gulo]|jgi:two-component system sensor histidine kinase/response regulator